MSTSIFYTTFFESVSITAETGDASADVVYAVPAQHDTEVEFLLATNGGSTQKISIQIYHADDTTYHYVLRSHSVAGNDSYKLVGPDRIYLHAGDKVVAFKEGGTFDVSISGKQFFNPSRGV